MSLNVSSDMAAPRPPLPDDSAVTKAEMLEARGEILDEPRQSPAKKVKLDDSAVLTEPHDTAPEQRVKGVASIKRESVSHPCPNRAVTDVS